MDRRHAGERRTRAYFHEVASKAALFVGWGRRHDAIFSYFVDNLVQGYGQRREESGLIKILGSAQHKG